MKAILFAVALTAMSVGPARAVLIALLLPFDATSELVVSMVNRCATRADYSVVIKNAINGAVLFETQGTIAPNRGKAIPYSSPGFGMVSAHVTWECRGTAQPRPLISYTVRDLETKVPRFIGTAMDGNDI